MGLLTLVGEPVLSKYDFFICNSGIEPGTMDDLRDFLFGVVSFTSFESYGKMEERRFFLAVTGSISRSGKEPGTIDDLRRFRLTGVLVLEKLSPPSMIYD